MSRNRKKRAEVIKAFKEKGFINEELAGYIEDMILAAMPVLGEANDKYGLRPKDMLRFQIVSETCRSQREKKGIAFKQASLALKVPQYRLKYIESSGVKYINAGILECYIDYLGLRDWFDSWKEYNLDVYKRLSK